jgi:thiaminase/transcriptional activator TenA
MSNSGWADQPGETMAALTPCMRLYGHLGTELAKTIGAGNPYQQWFTTYSGPNFLGFVVRVKSYWTRWRAVRDAYAYAVRCELNFFPAMLEHNA